MPRPVDTSPLDDSPHSPAHSELTRVLIYANLARMRLLAWVLVVAMPVLAAVDAWVMLSLGPSALPDAWLGVLAIRVLWLVSGAAFLLAGRLPSAPSELEPRHRLMEAVFLPLWLAMAGIHSGVGASSGSNVSIYLIAIFTTAAFLYLDFRRRLVVYGLAWAIMVGAMVHLQSTAGTRVGPDIINGSFMTVLAAIVSRVAYTTRAREHHSQRLIASQKADLERANLELETANAVLQRASMLDHLTGVPNRRSFEETLSREWKRSARETSPIGLIMIDVDYFKGFNDGYGHKDGDACLVKIAGAIRGALGRPGDELARYGGDEFAVILPGTDLDGARHVAEKIQLAVDALDILHSGSAEGRVTISLGIASRQPGYGSAPDSLVSAADRALYHAKRDGRNLIF